MSTPREVLTETQNRGLLLPEKGLAARQQLRTQLRGHSGRALVTRCWETKDLSTKSLDSERHRLGPREHAAPSVVPVGPPLRRKGQWNNSATEPVRGRQRLVLRAQGMRVSRLPSAGQKVAAQRHWPWPPACSLDRARRPGGRRLQGGGCWLQGPLLAPWTFEKPAVPFLMKAWLLR